jgi:arsenite methyltransferase
MDTRTGIQKMSDYLDSKFDWTDPAVVSAFDDLSLWSSMAGMLLLEHVPLKPGIRALDVACGTGFPLLELAERLGPTSTVAGVDLSETALDRARQKANVRGIHNVEIIRADAAALPWPDQTFDLIISNLGINNFANPSAAFRECFRVAKTDATLALATNLVGHMHEFYEAFRQTLIDLGLSDLLPRLDSHIAHRTTIDKTNALLQQAGFIPTRSETRTIPTRFANGSALFHHSLIRAGFLPAWIEVVHGHDPAAIFASLETKLNHELRLTVPFAYIDARKP